MTQANTIWDQICRTIKNKVGETAFEAWLKPIKPKIDEHARVLALEVPNDFF